MAWAQLDAGDVGEGSCVMIVGVAGALGSTLASLAKFRGAKVIGLGRLPEQAEILEPIGLDAAFDSGQSDLAESLLTATDGHGVDFVVDNLGIDEVWQAYTPALASMGRIVVSGSIRPDPISLALPAMYINNQSVLGVRTGNRKHIDETWRAVADGWRLPEGFVKTASIDTVVEAHRAVETGERWGQDVLTMPFSRRESWT